MAERYDAGIVTAYGAAVRGGYTGTYDEFCAQQAGYAQNAAAVEQAKSDAQAAAQTAQNVAASIPADYSQMSDDVSSLKEDKADINSVYVTDTASGSIASFPDGADNVPVKSLKVNIEPVQAGTGDPSPDNVRPISGHTQAVVTRTGKNLFDKDSAIDGLWDSGGVFLPEQTNYLAVYCHVKPNTSYVLSGNASWDSPRLCYFNTENPTTFTRRQTAQASPFVFTTDSDTVLIGFNPSKASYGDGSAVQCELGSIHTAYEPYSADTYTIDLDGTRYGGTLDVGTGVLTVDRKMIDGGIVTWSKLGDGKFYSANITDAKAGSSTGGYDIVICSIYKPVNIASLASMFDCSISMDTGKHIQIRDDRFTDASAFKNSLSGVPLVYKLANPQTIQLTANEISTVLGQNNIWADTGDVEVEYRADTKLYIEKLTAPTEDDMIADHAISANSFFMVGNTLYRATTAIASGATITVGTNAVKMSLSEALNALA